MKRKHHFKESYLHKFAKTLLAKWLRKKYLRVDVESRFYLDGEILFVPDIVCYNEEGIKDIYEVYYKNEINAKKLSNIHYYVYVNNLDIGLFEVSAKHILNQTKEPENILMIEFNIN